MDGMQGELFSEEELLSCETHKEFSDGRKYMVLADLRNYAVVRRMGNEPLAAFRAPMGTVRGMADPVHTDRDSGSPCFRESN